MRKFPCVFAVIAAFSSVASLPGTGYGSASAAGSSTKIQDRIDASTQPSPPIPAENPTRAFARLRARLDQGDQIIALRALHLALSQVPDGGTFAWRKRSRSLKGLIQPTKAFRNADGQVCRHVIYTLSLGRYLKQIEGIACRQDDGRWQL